MRDSYYIEIIEPKPWIIISQFYPIPDMVDKYNGVTKELLEEHFKRKINQVTILKNDPS